MHNNQSIHLNNKKEDEIYKMKQDVQGEFRWKTNVYLYLMRDQDNSLNQPNDHNQSINYFQFVYDISVGAEVSYLE